MNEFYVYAHKNNGKVFYVGKGRRRRAWAISGRNNKWKKFTENCITWDVVMLAENLSEKSAHSLEIETIKGIGLENLCNLTAGGEGVVGFRFSDEQRLKLSLSHIGVSAGDKHPLFGTRRPKETRDKISNSLRGNKNRGTKPLSKQARAKISENRKGKRAGMQHPMVDSKIRLFTHTEHGFFKGTQFELREKYGLCQANISAVCRGKRKSCLGWSLS